MPISPNNFEVFENSEFGSIRAMDADNEVWFICCEVTAILGYSNSSAAVRKHVDRSDKSKTAIYDGRQHRYYTIINEKGLYDLASRSRRPEARLFKKWIAAYVLESVRKNRSNLTVPSELFENSCDRKSFEESRSSKSFEDCCRETSLAQKLKEIDDRERLSIYHREKHSQEASETAAFSAVVGNCVDAVLIRDYVKILAEANIQIGQHKFFKWLNSHRYIYRDKTLDQWIAYKKYVDMGLFSVTHSVIRIPNFGERLNFTIKITEIGQTYFYEELRKEYEKGAK